MLWISEQFSDWFYCFFVVQGWYDVDIVVETGAHLVFIKGKKKSQV